MGRSRNKEGKESVESGERFVAIYLYSAAELTFYGVLPAAESKGIQHAT